MNVSYLKMNAGIQKPLILALGLLALAFFQNGCESSKGMNPSEMSRARFVLETNASDGYAAAVRMPISQVQIALESEAILSEFDYQSIAAVDLELGKCLLFTLNPAASRELYRISVTNQGKRVVLLVNGEPVGVRRFDGPIQDGRLHVFLELEDSKVEELAIKLNETNRDIQKKLSR